jgi:hypothetical protein
MNPPAQPLPPDPSDSRSTEEILADIARRQAEVRRMFRETFTPEDAAALMRAMMARAMAGDVEAASLVLHITAGPPPVAADPDEFDLPTLRPWENPSED